MINPFDVNKRRDIVFSAEPEGQLERASQLLAGLPGCTVQPSELPLTLHVSYNLLDYTLEGLETKLEQEGFVLDHSLLHGIGRQIIYYCEDTTRHNLETPEHHTKYNGQEVFVQVYEHHEHGDHDSTPPELREYK